MNTAVTTYQFRRKLRPIKPDIVHINSALDKNGLFRDFLTVSFLQKKKVPIFIKFHGSDENLIHTGNIFLRLMTRKLFQWVDGVGVLSSEEKINLSRAGVPEIKLFVVKNILKNSSYVKSDELLSRFGATVDMPILLFVARFIPTKGLIDVVNASCPCPLCS